MIGGSLLLCLAAPPSHALEVDLVKIVQNKKIVRKTKKTTHPTTHSTTTIFTKDLLFLF